MAGIPGDTSILTFLYEIIREFISLALRVAPFLLLGAATAAALQTYMPLRWTTRLLGRGTSSVWIASVLAAVLPGCSCATGPMAEGLRRQGGRLGTVTAFLMMSPLLAPHTILLTWGVLGWRFAVARVAVPFLVIPALGVLLNRLEHRPGWEIPAPVAGGALDEGCECGGESCVCGLSIQRPNFVTELIDVLRRVARPFLMGLAAAAALGTFVPEDAIPRTIGSAGLLAYLTAALIGIPIYVCEGEEVPLTYAALGLGLAPGPAFTFLLGAVGTCVPTMLMARRILGDRATAAYVGSWFVFAVGAGLLFQLTLRL